MKLKKGKTFFSITTIIVAVVIIHYIGWLRPIENFLRDLIIPGSKAMYSWSFWLDPDEIEKIQQVDELQARYKELEQRYLDALVDQTELSILREENAELREQLDFFDEKQYFQHVGAEVVGENIDPVGSTVIINRGEDDGVKDGNPVIVGSGIMVGRILRAEKHTSLVRLLNDSQSKVAAMVMNGDKSAGLVEGGFGVSVRMNFIPQNEKVSVGDMIVTSGLEEGVPAGLLIGSVEVIEKEAYQPFQKAILSTLVDFNKIGQVSVVISKHL